MHFLQIVPNPLSLLFWWQEWDCSENHHFPSLLFDWKQPSFYGFPKVGCSAHLIWDHVKDDCGNLFPLVVKPHAVPRNSITFSETFLCAFVIIKTYMHNSKILKMQKSVKKKTRKSLLICHEIKKNFVFFFLFSVLLN